MANARPFIIALAFGLIAVGLVYFYVQKVQDEAGSTDIEMARVVRAKEYIPRDTTITDRMIEEIEIPEEFVTPDHVTELDEIVGKVSVTVIYETQTLMAQMFEEETQLENLSRQLDEGERAVTVGISEISGLGGNLKPGNSVDVLVSILDNDEVGVASTFTILRNIDVMAVGQDIGFEDDEEATGSISKSVTLRVEPEEAQLLALATEVGSIRLVLRHPDDQFAPLTSGTALTDFVSYTQSRDDREEAESLALQREAEAEQAAAELELERLRLEYQMRMDDRTYGREISSNSGSPEPDVVELQQLGPPPIIVQMIHGGETTEVALPRN